MPTAATAPAQRTASRAGLALLVVSAAMLACAPLIATRIYAYDVSVATMLAARFGTAAAIFWVVVAVRRTPLPPRRWVLRGLLQGALFYGTQALCFFTAVDRMSASIATVIFYLYPALVFVIAVPLGRDRFSGLRLAAAPVAIAGVCLTAAGGGLGSVDRLGIALAAASALAYVGFTLHGDSIAAHAEPEVLVALLSTGAVATFTVFGLATGQLHGPVPGPAIAWIVAVAITSTIAYVTFFMGIRRVGPSLTSIVSMLEPVFVVAASAVLLGERLAPLQLVGAAVVVASLVAVNVIELRRRARPRGAT